MSDHAAMCQWSPNRLDLAALQTEIDQQRRFLKPSEIEEFDSAWGMDPTGTHLFLFPSMSLFMYTPHPVALPMTLSLSTFTVSMIHDSRHLNYLQNATQENFPAEKFGVCCRWVLNWTLVTG